MEFMDFFTGTSIWVYIFIFLGKITEVSISTLRLVLINRGERIVGSIIALFEVALWIVVTGTVIVNFHKDLIKVIVYVAAFGIGNYIGSWLEAKLAFGLCAIQVILQEGRNSDKLVDELRAQNFGVTIMEGQGMDGKRQVLLLNLRRKRISQALKIVHNIIEEPVITISDLKLARGGYLKK